MNTTVPHFIKWSVLGVGLLIAAASLYFYKIESDTSIAVENKNAADAYVQLAQNYVTKDYNLKRAVALYGKALQQDPSSASALYEITRAYSVLGNQSAALAFAERYITKYPNDPKILYTAGLAAGFAGDFIRSESYFNTYLSKNTQAKWQSRLDLAWAQYQQGKYTDAKKTIDEAISLFGDNMWLNTSQSAIEYALGNKAAAQVAIEKAEKGADSVDINTWNSNYSFSGPDHYEKGMAQMRKIIGYNKSLIAGKNVEISKEDFTAMAGFAPELGKGIVVSACGESCGPQTCTSAPNACGATQSWQVNSCVDSHGAPTANNQSCSTNPLPPPPVPERYGQSCTSINLCGIQATGTVQCDGRCSAIAPLQTSFGQGCTVRNRCGTANGSVGCNGQCNVASYPTCTNPDDSVTGGDDGWTEVTIDDTTRFPGQNFGNIGLQISVAPSLVRSGQRTVVRWNSVEMNSCTVTGTNGDSWSGIQGEEITRPITLRVTYTLSCTSFDGRVMTDTAVVGLAPVMCEIGQQGCEQQ